MSFLGGDVLPWRGCVARVNLWIDVTVLLGWTERNTLQTASSPEGACYDIVVPPDIAFGSNTFLFVPQHSSLSVVLAVL